MENMEVKHEPGDFGWAMKCIRDGQKVKRANWKDSVIFLKEGDTILEPDVLKIQTQVEYRPSHEDLLSSDWEVVSDE